VISSNCSTAIFANRLYRECDRVSELRGIRALGKLLMIKIRYHLLMHTLNPLGIYISRLEWTGRAEVFAPSISLSTRLF